MQVGDLKARLAASSEQVLTAMYHMARADMEMTTYGDLYPGCSDIDLENAEQRIGRRLHPLHRLLLRQSNGGMIPYVSSVRSLAAAIAPDSSVHQARDGAEVTSEPGLHGFTTRPSSRPKERLAIGESLRDTYSAEEYASYGLESFIVVAIEFDGLVFGYVQGDPARIDVAGPDIVRAVAAPDFERFILNQHLSVQYATTNFVETVRAWLGHSESG